MFYNYNFFAKYFKKSYHYIKVDKKLGFVIFSCLNYEIVTLYNNYICPMMLQASFLNILNNILLSMPTDQLKQLSESLEGTLLYDDLHKTLYATDASAYRISLRRWRCQNESGYCKTWCIRFH
jgi:hypothetical protein